MTARTRRWVVLSALGLLSLDLALVAVAAPRAREWLESARASALVRAGTTALRDLGGPGARGVENLGAANLTRFTHRGAGVYAFILSATPRGAAHAAAVLAPREARCLIVEARCERAMAADCPSNCPTPSCLSSGCPKNSAPQGTTSRSSATGLPTSMLGVTLE